MAELVVWPGGAPKGYGARQEWSFADYIAYVDVLRTMNVMLQEGFMGITAEPAEARANFAARSGALFLAQKLIDEAEERGLHG